MKKPLQTLGLAAGIAAAALGFSKDAKAYELEDYVPLVEACTDTITYAKHTEHCDQANNCFTTPNAPQCTPLLESALAELAHSPLTQEPAHIIEPQPLEAVTDTAAPAPTTQMAQAASAPVPGTAVAPAPTTIETLLAQEPSSKVSRTFADLNTPQEVDEFIAKYLGSITDQTALLKIALDNAENTSWTVAPVVKGNNVLTPVLDSDSGEKLYLMMQIDPAAGISSAAKSTGTPVGADSARLNGQLADVLKLKPETIVQVIEDSWRTSYACADVFGDKAKRDRFKSALEFEQRKQLADAMAKGTPCKVSLAATDSTLIEVVPNDILYKGDKLKAQIVVDGTKIHEGTSIDIPAASHLVASNDHILILANSAVAIRESAMLRSGLYNSSNVDISNPVIERIREVKDNKPVVVAYSEGFTATVDAIEDLVAKAILLDPEGKPLRIEESDHKFTLDGNVLTFYANPQTVGTYTVDAMAVDDKGFKTPLHIAYDAKMPQEGNAKRGRDEVSEAVDDYVFNELGFHYAHRINDQPHPTFALHYDRGVAKHLSLGLEGAIGWKNTADPQADQITIFEQQNTTNQGTPVLLDQEDRVERSVMEDTIHNEYRSAAIAARIGIPFNEHVSIIGVAGVEHKRHDENHEGQITDYFNNGQTSSIGLDLDQTHKSDAFYHGGDLSFTGNKGWGVDFGYRGAVNKNGYGDKRASVGIHKRFGGNNK